MHLVGGPGQLGVHVTAAADEIALDPGPGDRIAAKAPQVLGRLLSGREKRAPGQARVAVRDIDSGQRALLAGGEPDRVCRGAQ